MLSLGQLYTDDDDTNNGNNDTQRTNHDCIGSLACMPNEPKTKFPKNSNVLLRAWIWISQSFEPGERIVSASYYYEEINKLNNVENCMM